MGAWAHLDMCALVQAHARMRADGRQCKRAGGPASGRAGWRAAMRAGMRAGVGWVGMRAGGYASEHASGYASGGWWMSMCVRAYFQAGKRARAGRGKSQPPVCQPLADGRLGTCGHVRARASTCARAHACTSVVRHLHRHSTAKGSVGKEKAGAKRAGDRESKQISGRCVRIHGVRLYGICAQTQRA